MTWPLLTSETAAPVTSAPVASVTTPRMDAAGQAAAESARNAAAMTRDEIRDETRDETRDTARHMIREEVRRGVERKKMEIGMRAPSFPSERESGLGYAEDRSPDLR